MQRAAAASGVRLFTGLLPVGHPVRAGVFALAAGLFAMDAGSAGVEERHPGAAESQRVEQARMHYERARAAAHERLRHQQPRSPAGIPVSPHETAGSQRAHPEWARHRPSMNPPASTPANAESAGAEEPGREHLVPFFPNAARAEGQGVVRVINRSDQAGEVSIVAVDDAGVRFAPLSLAIGGREARQFTAADLERGAPAKGIEAGLGRPSQGDWRLSLTSSLDIQVLGLLRGADGFVASLHDRLAKVPTPNGSVRQASMFNPAGNTARASRLRLVNRGEQPATITVSAVDDRGDTAARQVRATIPPGETRTLTADDLETGSPDTTGAFGDGHGKWRLALVADQPVHVLNLLASPSGLANLSAPPPEPMPAEDGLDEESGLVRHRIPYFPSTDLAVGADGVGFVRLINDSEMAGTVEIRALDQSARQFAPIQLAIGGGEAVHFDAADLERGNPAKGINVGTGAGEGAWRLELATTLTLRTGVYFRAADGLLSGLNAVAPETTRGYEVPFFNPSDDMAQRSLLRLVNWDDEDAAVVITGRDDSGAPAAHAVSLTVPARGARTLDAWQLETGDAAGLDGALGDGVGKWRLAVATAVSLQVMSLLESDAGLANVSTVAKPEDRSAAGIFSAHVSAIVQSKCVRCHVAGGAAAAARLRFTPAAASADHQALNLEALRRFLDEVEDGAEIFLNRIQGIGHGGGVQVAANTEDHVQVARLLARLGEEVAPTPSVANLFDGVRLEAPRNTLRRAALVFAGRTPTQAEYAAVEAGGLGALRGAVRGLMEGDAFHEFLLRAANDRLLTDRELERFAVIGNDGFFVTYDNEYVRLRQAQGREIWDWHHAVQYGAGRAPLELIAHVVENDLPYTDILTADYIMANPPAARVYGADTEFDDPDNIHEFKPSAILRYHHHGPGYEAEYLPGVGVRVIRPGPLARHPHAGLLNTKAFLQRFPTTATNRNRARARWAYYHFLGVDVEQSASRTTDPVALADRDNPTRKNPACTVCHGALDVVAGAFQNYGDSGYYRDKWGGFDALDYHYKNGTDSAQAIQGDSWARRSTLSWPLRPPPGEATVGFTYTNDFYDEKTRYDGTIYVDSLRVLDEAGREIARHEFETAPPRTPRRYCGAQNWNHATRKGDHLRLWNGGYECAVHVPFVADGEQQYTVEVVAWGSRHDRYGEAGYPKVSVVVDPYRVGDTWYRDMRPPGFDEEALPDSDDSLAWLGRRLVADDRFATATVRFWWPAVMGREVAEPPATAQDADFQGRLLAATAQGTEVRRLADGFRTGFGDGKAHNLKDLLVELALSAWFRAAAAEDLDAVRAVALAHAGAKRLLTPEELSRKTDALTGFEWGRWRHPSAKPHRQHRSWLTDQNGYRLLYGGIDSDGITVRARDMTSVMAGVSKSHAAHVSCPVVLRELYLLPDAERRLFGGIEAAVSPHFELGGRLQPRPAKAIHTVRGHLTAGAKTVFLKFPNDHADARGDRNVYLDRLDVRDATGAVVQTVELERASAPPADNNCNKPLGGHYALYCKGWVEASIVVDAPGNYALDVLAWADWYGDEAPRLDVVVDAAAPTAAAVAAIKRKLVELHEKLLGVRLDPDADEITTAYRLFTKVWQRQRATAGPQFFDKACHWDSDIRFLDGFVADAVREGVDAFGPYKRWNWAKANAFWGSRDTSDPHFTARTWVVLLAHLMTDYRYLHL